MSTTTTNYGLTKPDYADFADISIVNNSLDIIDSTMKSISDSSKFVMAGGTNTVITLTLPTLTNGYSTTFIASYNNGGSATTINGKNLYKPNTTTAPTIIKGKAYTIWYDLANNCFFTKASAEGNTIPSHVLAGDTFSNDTDTGQVGTLDLSNLTSSNIKSGVTINGVTGSSNVVDTSDGSAIASQILNTKTAYVNGAKLIGSMPNRPNQQTPLSYWNDGNGTLKPRIPTGAYITEQTSGITEINCYSGDYKASNIVNGKSVFGLNGTATIESLGGRKFIKGTGQFKEVTINSDYCQCFWLTGLSFKPVNGYIFEQSSTDIYRIAIIADGVIYSKCDSNAINNLTNNSTFTKYVIYSNNELRVPMTSINGTGHSGTYQYFLTN